MLLKVFKNSFKKPLKPILIILACSPVIALVIAGLNWVTFFADITSLTYSTCTLLLVLSYMALIGTVVASGVLFIVNMTKEVASDQAYLTFTLPVKAKHQVLGRYLSALAYVGMIISVTAISILLIAIISPVYEGEYETVRTIFSYLSGGILFDTLFVIETVVKCFLIFTCAFFFLFIIIMFAKNSSVKVKPLIIVGIIIGTEILLAVSSLWSSVIIEKIFNYGAITTKDIQIYQLIQLGIFALIGFLLYKFLERYTEKQINLT